MDAKDILDKLTHHGFEAYIVGGYVRDKILNIDSYDIDIATNATYQQLERIFSDVKKSEVGKNFQIMIIDGIEVATYRKDIYNTNNDLIDTEVVSDIVDDLERRDLTINSMAMGYDKIIDPFGGQEDLKKGIIRFTGNARRRINEDPVRMIRACRFLALIERSRFAKDTFYAIGTHAGLIGNIPKERIRLEVIKAMKSKNAGNFFRALKNTGLLPHIFPRMIATIGHDGGVHHNETIFSHCVMTCDNIPVNKPLLKIAAFLHDIGKPASFLLNSNGSFRGHDKIGSSLAREELKELKFNNVEIDYISSLIELHMLHLTLDVTERTIRKTLVKLKERNINFEDLCHLTIADHDSNIKKEKHPKDMFDKLKEKFLSQINENKTFSIKDLAVNGRDVMEILDIDPGPKVGEILTNLFKLVIDKPKLNNKDILIDLIKKEK